MERTTLTTYLFLQGSIRIDAWDAEIHFTDYGSRETVSIEGMSRNELHNAILLYMHNLSLQKDSDGSNTEWFNQLISKATEAIERIEPNTNQTEEEP